MIERFLPKWLRTEDYRNLPISERILMLAAARVGERESRVKKNQGEFVDMCLAAVGLRPGYAWCAAFVYWLCRTAGVPADLLPQRRSAAAVINWDRWARANQIITTSPRRGDLMFWLNSNGTGHMGIVTSVNGDEFRSIEGNTNESGSREGDGVYRKTRKMGGKIQFISLTSVSKKVRG
jgi:hypothetical protein